MSLVSRKDVTAVKFYKNYILAGIGSFASAFDKQTGQLLQRLSVLSSDNIYGFVISNCENKILVFGKKQFTVLQLAEENGMVIKVLFDVIKIVDWIQSAVWIDDNNFALLTCHNIVMRYNWSTQVMEMNGFKDYSVLYSGLLLLVAGRLLILAGTVSSEITIRWFLESNVMHRLTGHRGVIFSISCNPEKGILASTSDDRSIRIWEMVNPGHHPPDTIEFWQNITIKCKFEVYGHTARVMRNVIVNDLIVSGGEDACLCYWRDGVLVRKVSAHQTAAVWCMDSDGQHLVTGGGDGSVKLHPLTVATDYGDKRLLQLHGTTKIVNFTARGNIVSLNTNSDLLYYNLSTKDKKVYKLIHESTYKMMALSSCRQIIAVADMFGNLSIFIENCKNAADIRKVFDTKLTIGKLNSMHFAGNRYLVLCAERGEILVLTASGSDITPYAKFTLPPCKERWLTACAIDPQSDMLIVADRCSGVHCFLKDIQDPVKSFPRVHGRYGSTSLTIRGNSLISTGRDGSIKYFTINRQHLSESKYLKGRELDFQWVEKFLDKDESLICGFQENTFIVYDMKSNSKIIQTVCGGGHRSYDAMRYFQKVNGVIEECIMLVYLKSSLVYIIDFQLSLIVSKTILNGSHSKGINSLKVLKIIDSPMSFFVSGGEDTTLRVSTMDECFNFEDQYIFKHLSNVKAVKLIPHNDKLLVISAGGRAQICVNSIWMERTEDNKPKVLFEELTTLMLKGTDEERRRNKNLNLQEVDSDPEIRMMDIDVIQYDHHKYFVFIGTSDGVLIIYTLTDKDNRIQLKQLREVKHYDACILKVVCKELSANVNIVANCMTTGQVVIWNLVYDEENFDLIPSFPNKCHSAGVNSLDFNVITDDLLLMATGGDDNRVALTLLEVRALDQANLLLTKGSWFSDEFHSSQVTEVAFFADNLLASASIDQRVTILKWAASATTVECTYLHQICSDIADVQGMLVLDYGEGCKWSHLPQWVRVCVYGKGFEVIHVHLPRPL